MPVDLSIQRSLLNEPPDAIRCQMADEPMEELVSSIRQLGVLEPLLVTPTNPVKFKPVIAESPASLGDYIDDGGRFEIMDGHRRYIAAGTAGLVEVPCRVYEDAEEIKFAIMLHANQMREDVTAAEEGLLFIELAGKRGWSVEQICKFFRRSEGYVNDRVDIATLDQSVRDAVIARKVTPAIAKELLKVKDEQHRRYLLSLTVEHGSNMATVRQYVAQWRTQKLLEEGKPNPHTPGHAIVSEPPAQPRCTFCQRDDDQGNMVSVPIHNYHRRDLLELLRQVGIRVIE